MIISVECKSLSEKIHKLNLNKSDYYNMLDIFLSSIKTYYNYLIIISIYKIIHIKVVYHLSPQYIMVHKYPNYIIDIYHKNSLYNN